MVWRLCFHLGRSVRRWNIPALLRVAVGKEPIKRLRRSGRGGQRKAGEPRDKAVFLPVICVGSC